VEIRVWDNGTGIPADIKDKLFQPFFATKPTGEGTGLDLSISYDIVTKQHGGSIAVDSNVGKSSSRYGCRVIVSAMPYRGLVRIGCFQCYATQIRRMPYHRFKVGQTVVAPSEARDLHIPRGPLVIVRLLPLVDGQPQYRVRSEADGLDRVVLERQIGLAEDWSPHEPSPSKPASGRR
jgi:hypothetical protein